MDRNGFSFFKKVVYLDSVVYWMAYNILFILLYILKFAATTQAYCNLSLAMNIKIASKDNLLNTGSGDLLDCIGN